MPKKLSDSEIAERLKIGRNFVKRFARNDRDASAKFRDASNVPGYIPLDDDSNDLDGGDVPIDTPVGQTNLLATNIITKVASIAVNCPDWHVKVRDDAPEDAANIVREFLKSKWRMNSWTRMSQKALYKRYVAGMGVLAYRWDPDNHSTFEHVQSWDLAIDPNVRDWRRVDWAARKLKMSKRAAAARYPKGDFGVPEGASADAERVEIWLYYDRDEEVHVWDDTVLERGANLYKTVPFLFFEGDIDPGTSVWPLSDFVLAAGLQVELSDLNLAISNSAKHGGPLNLVDKKRIGNAGMEALESGVSQGFIPVDDIVTPPLHRIEGEPLSEALIEAKREAQQALDSITGVNQFQRGVVNQGVKFATEAALIGQQSGARGIQAREEFEGFLDRMSEAVVMMEVAFGGPNDQKPDEMTDELAILWEAFLAVVEVNVLEASTTYKDPQSDLQQGMQLVQLMAGLFPLLAQAGQPVPNMKQYIDDVLRASGKTDPERYWQAPPPPDPMMMGGPGAGPQGAGPAPAGMGASGQVLAPGNQ